MKGMRTRRPRNPGFLMLNKKSCKTNLERAQSYSGVMRLSAQNKRIAMSSTSRLTSARAPSFMDGTARKWLQLSDLISYNLIDHNTWSLVQKSSSNQAQQRLFNQDTGEFLISFFRAILIK